MGGGGGEHEGWGKGVAVDGALTYHENPGAQSWRSQALPGCASRVPNSFTNSPDLNEITPLTTKKHYFKFLCLRCLIPKRFEAVHKNTLGIKEGKKKKVDEEVMAEVSTGGTLRQMLVRQ